MEVKDIIIIGAGLCGSLLAARMAQKGHRVRLIEKRGDLRQEDISAGRSINLALSDRGLKALSMVGLGEEVRSLCIPMHGRMIHDREGNARSSRYSGRQKDYINSISRGGLNALLLDKAESFNNVSIYFNYQCESINPEKGKATFLDQSGNKHDINGDVIFGTDGAGSVVRKSIRRHLGEAFDVSQDFLSHGYKELHIPPGPGGSFQLDKNSLHIWPRGKYMIIALPNLDASFTVTMFNPMEGEYSFEEIDSQGFQSYLADHFSNLMPFIEPLQESYSINPVGKLGTIKCKPWNVEDKVCILGDAAHAIVPFYGQGMNASFEDVYDLDLFIQAQGADWLSNLTEFQSDRSVATDAIADLAIDNFHEMQSHVADPNFVKKRMLEMQMEQTIPEYYSKYSLVTFKDDISYKRAMDQGRMQDAFLLDACKAQEELPDPQKTFELLKQHLAMHNITT